MYVEQAPNPESRLKLSGDLDALGMPKLVVDWRLTPTDAESFYEIHRGLTDAFLRAGLGELDFGPEPPTLAETSDAAHHLGGTRMGSTPRSGVVDANCLVFGTRNLFIASTSVYPTGHSVAPTLTLLALTKRLAAHLVTRRS